MSASMMGMKNFQRNTGGRVRQSLPAEIVLLGRTLLYPSDQVGQERLGAAPDSACRRKRGIVLGETIESSYRDAENTDGVLTTHIVEGGFVGKRGSGSVSHGARPESVDNETVVCLRPTSIPTTTCLTEAS